MPPATRHRAQPQPSPPHHFIDPASDSDESDDEGVDDEELIEDVEGEDEEEEDEEEPLGRWTPPYLLPTRHFPHHHTTRSLHFRFVPFSASVLCQFIYVSYLLSILSISTFGVTAENNVDHRGLGFWLLAKHTYIAMSYSMIRVYLGKGNIRPPSRHHSTSWNLAMLISPH